MTAAPALPLFGDAYMADTRHLSLEEHGAYLSLLLIAWRTAGCCLPANDKRLAQMLGISAARWGKLKPTVMAFWTIENGSWVQRRLAKERAFVEEKRAKNRASANTRWNTQPIENKESGRCERSSERNAPPPTPKKEEEKKEERLPASDDAALAFSGNIIRLNQRDFDKWQEAYSLLDLKANLQSRDDWLANEADEKARKKWFISTSNWLAKKQQEATAAALAPDAYAMMP